MNENKFWVADESVELGNNEQTLRDWYDDVQDWRDYVDSKVGKIPTDPENPGDVTVTNYYGMPGFFIANNMLPTNVSDWAIFTWAIKPDSTSYNYVYVSGLTDNTSYEQNKTYNYNTDIVIPTGETVYKTINYTGNTNMLQILVEAKDSDGNIIDPSVALKPHTSEIGDGRITINTSGKYFHNIYTTSRKLYDYIRITYPTTNIQLIKRNSSGDGWDVDISSIVSKIDNLYDKLDDISIRTDNIEKTIKDSNMDVMRISHETLNESEDADYAYAVMANGMIKYQEASGTSKLLHNTSKANITILNKYGSSHKITLTGKSEIKNSNIVNFKNPKLDISSRNSFDVKKLIQNKSINTTTGEVEDLANPNRYVYDGYLYVKEDSFITISADKLGLVNKITSGLMIATYDSNRTLISTYWLQDLPLEEVGTGIRKMITVPVSETTHYVKIEFSVVPSSPNGTNFDVLNSMVMQHGQSESVPEYIESSRIRLEYEHELKRIGNVFDEIDVLKNKLISKIGVRAFIEGDTNVENSMLTDGTNTLYLLDDPIITNIKRINNSYSGDIFTFQDSTSLLVYSDTSVLGEFSVKIHDNSPTSLEAINALIEDINIKIASNENRITNLENVGPQAPDTTATVTLSRGHGIIQASQPLDSWMDSIEQHILDSDLDIIKNNLGFYSKMSGSGYNAYLAPQKEMANKKFVFVLKSDTPSGFTKLNYWLVYDYDITKVIKQSTSWIRMGGSRKLSTGYVNYNPAGNNTLKITKQTFTETSSDQDYFVDGYLRIWTNDKKVKDGINIMFPSVEVILNESLNTNFWAENEFYNYCRIGDLDIQLSSNKNSIENLNDDLNDHISNYNDNINNINSKNLTQDESIKDLFNSTGVPYTINSDRFKIIPPRELLGKDFIIMCFRVSSSSLSNVSRIFWDFETDPNSWNLSGAFLNLGLCKVKEINTTWANSGTVKIDFSNVDTSLIPSASANTPPFITPYLNINYFCNKQSHYDKLISIKSNSGSASGTTVKKIEYQSWYNSLNSSYDNFKTLSNKVSTIESDVVNIKEKNISQDDKISSLETFKNNLADSNIKVTSSKFSVPTNKLNKWIPDTDDRILSNTQSILDLNNVLSTKISEINANIEILKSEDSKINTRIDNLSSKLDTDYSKTLNIISDVFEIVDYDKDIPVYTDTTPRFTVPVNLYGRQWIGAAWSIDNSSTSVRFITGASIDNINKYVSIGEPNKFTIKIENCQATPVLDNASLGPKAIQAPNGAITNLSFSILPYGGKDVTYSNLVTNNLDYYNRLKLCDPNIKVQLCYWDGRGWKF